MSRVVEEVEARSSLLSTYIDSTIVDRIRYLGPPVACLAGLL
jgi:hypothetical protein